MTSPGDPVVPVTDEGTAYTAQTVSGAQAITEATAYSVMNGDVLGSFGQFGLASNSGLAATAASIGSTTWGQAVNSTASSALSNAGSAQNTANGAIQGMGVISAGVTNNITGASYGTSPVDVGPAVQLLNATVQAGANAPRIDIYNTSATWTQQAGMKTAQIMLISGGGGGAQGGVAFGGTGAAGGGGGQGGYSIYSGITAASLPATAPVVVPLGGAGGGMGTGSSFFDGFQRANSSVLGANWRIDSPGQSNQIISDTAEAFTPGGGVGETGCWSTWTNPLVTDNWVVIAQLTAPTTSLATNNYTGVYGACATTFGAGSKLIAFVGDTSGGCGLISQVNAPSGAYYANGAGTGQTILAQSTTPFTATSQIALTRNGNVFTGWINGSAIVTWTDTGNTVPTGSGNRLCGFVTETNWPAFQPQYGSPALSSWTARDVNWTAQPGTAGGAASFNTTSYQVTGGAGGVGGGIDAGGTRRPATGSFLNTATSWTGAAGLGNQTNNAAGGVGAAGQTGFTPAGQAGGGGFNTGGGLAGNASALNGSPGISPSGGVYGPASGGGGGFYLPPGSASVAGQGGAGGFPGGGGGGGGATQDGLGANGPGGAGGDGQIVVTSYF